MEARIQNEAPRPAFRPVGASRVWVRQWQDANQTPPLGMVETTTDWVPKTAPVVASNTVTIP